MFLSGLKDKKPRNDASFLSGDPVPKEFLIDMIVVHMDVTSRGYQEEVMKLN